MIKNADFGPRLVGFKFLCYLTNQLFWLSIKLGKCRILLLGLLCSLGELVCIKVLSILSGTSYIFVVSVKLLSDPITGLIKTFSRVLFSAIQGHTSSRLSSSSAPHLGSMSVIPLFSNQTGWFAFLMLFLPLELGSASELQVPSLFSELL